MILLDCYRSFFLGLFFLKLGSLVIKLSSWNSSSWRSGVNYTFPSVLLRFLFRFLETSLVFWTGSDISGVEEFFLIPLTKMSFFSTSRPRPFFKIINLSFKRLILIWSLKLEFPLSSPYNRSTSTREHSVDIRRISFRKSTNSLSFIQGLRFVEVSLFSKVRSIG